MTVKELIEALKKYDPNMPVGGSGHYGEMLKIEDVSLHYSGEFICIDIQWAGDEPD